MTNSAKLRFHAWHKREEVFALHGWRAHEGLAFVEDLKGQQLVFRFMPLTDSGTVERWHPPPLPEVLPTKIEEIRLVPPPCRANEAEAELLMKESVTKEARVSGLLPVHGLPPPAWELARLRYDPEILTPQSEDDGPMTIRLDEFKKEMQPEFEARTQEVATLIELLDNGHSIIGFARYYALLASDDRATCRFLLNQERLSLPYDFTHGCLKWTLDDARRRPRLRNPIFRARWAKQNNWDFHQMAAELKELLNWLGLPVSSPHTLSPEMSLLLGRPLPDYRSAQFTESLSDFGAGSWDEILVGASARYRVTFANGQRAWIPNFRDRAPQDQSERQEFIQGQGPDTGADILERAGQQARADAEAGAATLGARTKDLAKILGKVSEIFADPLVEAAKEAAIKRDVPALFAFWVFQERHFAKFPSVDGAFKRSGLRPKLEQAGLAFSRASVGRWLKIIREELEKRNLMENRSPGSSYGKARDFDIEQAADASPRPGEADEPPEAFVKWVEDRDAAGAMPTEQDVLAYVRANAGTFRLPSYGDDELQEIAARWLKAAVEILDAVPTDRLETNEEDSPL
jgi:hypothetical protein